MSMKLSDWKTRKEWWQCPETNQWFFRRILVGHWKVYCSVQKKRRIRQLKKFLRSQRRAWRHFKLCVKRVRRWPMMPEMVFAKAMTCNDHAWLSECGVEKGEACIGSWKNAASSLAGLKEENIKKNIKTLCVWCDSMRYEKSKRKPKQKVQKQQLYVRSLFHLQLKECCFPYASC